MYDYGVIVAKVEEMVQNHMAKYDPSHDWHHVNRVRELSMTLANSFTSPLDMEIVEFSALLHDITDAKYIKCPSDEVDIQGFLSGLGYPVDKSNLVAEIVSRVGYRKELQYLKMQERDELRETCLELHCVQDADKLDAIGAIGILRCAGFSGAKNIALFNPEVDASSPDSEASGPYNSLGTAVSHFYDKLLKLKDELKSPKGKELAEQRHQTMVWFLSQLKKEQQLETSAL